MSSRTGHVNKKINMELVSRTKTEKKEEKIKIKLAADAKPRESVRQLNRITEKKNRKENRNVVICEFKEINRESHKTRFLEKTLKALTTYSHVRSPPRRL